MNEKEFITIYEMLGDLMLAVERLDKRVDKLEKGATYGMAKKNN